MTQTEPPAPWRQRRASIHRRWKVPFVFCEWCCERLAFQINQCALVRVLESLGKLSLLVAVVVYIWGIPERSRAVENAKKVKHYQAWQMINSAAGLSGDGGRKLALQDLCADEVNLDLINLSNAVFDGLQLHGCSMKRGNLDGTDFSSANIRLMNFYRASFRGSHSLGSRYLEACFVSVDARNAVFNCCHFTASTFEGADLRGASFINCDAKNVSFRFADLRGASISEFPSGKWKMSDLDFRDANIAGIQADPSIKERMTRMGAVSIEKNSEWDDFKRKQHFDPELQEMRFLLRP